MTIAERYGEWSNGTGISDISQDMLERTKLHILDQIGAQVSCRNMPTVKLAYDYARKYAREGKAHLVGTADRYDAEFAGFANGTAGSAFEIDDYGGNGAYSHPGCTVVPAAIALAEERGYTGADVLRGAALGFETVIRLSRASMPSMFLGRGFHHTSVLGVIGVAVTGGAMGRYTGEVVSNAISLAASQAAGTTEYSQSGGEVKRCHAGMAVAGGIRALRLAEAGLTAPPTILEGKRGFLQAYCDDYDETKLLDELGQRWFFLEHGAIKPYAACGLFHHHFAAYDDLLKTHGFAPEDIEQVELGCEPLMIVHNGAHGPEPKDIVGAQFSSKYSMAMRMVLGQNDVGAYLDMQDQKFSNPEILALARRISTKEVKEFGEFPPRGSVSVTLTDGRSFEAVGYALGSPENPLGAADIQEKYLQLVSRECGDDLARRSMEMILRLEDVTDLSEITRLFA
ncbi:MmgE/PrpD family protein [Paracoccus sp. SCSIO 75233]|uniref:MmgE/PrpD family protein n=1 Tax=Paracoccus sp. SCSIO 75233 TaxID=3017782 RepID=UPI0022F105D6|nr:MmgE/PrpD family protein [Paracoccus sp. SCSIO 75233]WBU53919.1 MmgE/PrpD family protein [Paracoccus sp. SCSIO 75233]